MIEISGIVQEKKLRWISGTVEFLCLLLLDNYST